VRLAGATTQRRPRFYDLTTADGVPYWHIALLHLDSVASTVVQHCAYWGNADQCTFCGIGLSLESGRTIARKTPEQLAEVAVAARAWAGLNPKAFKREPITIADVLDSTMISTPLRRLDCCLVTDGGGAVVVVRADRARDLAKPPVWLLGHGHSHSHLTIANMPDLTTTSAAQSGASALAMAGVTHDEVDVAQIYDSFTITVLLSLEALGFCGPGESGAFVEGGRTAPGGDFPMNTNGGGLSYCHPGMYGIFTLIEATRQLRGECGDRQVEDAKIALCNGTGGMLSSAATVVLARD
jgi:acetyl-CoA acetyltransferase